MLSAWNDENVNQVGPSQRGLGGGKSLKALGDAGLKSSENPPLVSGKGMLKQQHQQQQRKLKPLGNYSENAPPSAAKGKATAGLSNSSSKPQPLKQRRALVDISNAAKGASASLGGTDNPSSKLSGKQLTPGLKFTVHSDSRGGAVPGAKSGAKAPSGSVRFKSRVTVRGRSVVGPDGRVDDVEMLLGRTGDEEEVLVERKMEQRAALKYARPLGHRSSAVRSNRPRSRSTAPSFPKATSGSRSKPKFGRDITNTAASSSNGAYDAAGDGDGVSMADKSLDSAIDCILRDDFEDGRKGLMKTTGRAALEEPDLDMDAVAMALEALEEDTSPLGLLDDDFDTNDLDFNFA